MDVAIRGLGKIKKKLSVFQKELKTISGKEIPATEIKKIIKNIIKKSF